MLMTFFINSSEELQRYPNVLKFFSVDKDLLDNLDKTEVMVFDTTQVWVIRSKLELYLEEEKVLQDPWIWEGVEIWAPGLHKAHI